MEIFNAILGFKMDVLPTTAGRWLSTYTASPGDTLPAHAPALREESLRPPVQAVRFDDNRPHLLHAPRDTLLVADRFRHLTIHIYLPSCRTSRPPSSFLPRSRRETPSALTLRRGYLRGTDLPLASCMRLPEGPHMANASRSGIGRA